MKKRLATIGMVSAILILGVFVARSQINPKTTHKTMGESLVDFTTLLPNYAPAEFHYRVGSRFLATITKSELNMATSVDEIIPEEADWSAYGIHTITVRELQNLGESSRAGTNLELSTEQIALLKATGYSDSFRLTASYGKEGRIRYNGVSYDLAYFITVVPEKEASYEGGIDALMDYLKSNSLMETRTVEKEKLTPGKILFTVDTNGEITNLKLTESCSYKDIDALMIKLISETSGKWESARDDEGRKVDQELVYSYANAGC